ncbi:MAG TPA: CocE/NonD family hydrolase, partial [Acidimicrobiales bacterium]
MRSAPKARTCTRSTRSRGPLALVALVAAVALAGCSSSTSQGSGSDPPSAAASTASACRRPLPPHPVVATPVAGVPSDRDITSFDGTLIRAHWFPVELAGGKPAPTVLMGPGWSLSGDTDTQGSGVVGDVPIKDLRAHGYNVLTWDPRGFGRSGGSAEVDSPAYEGRDVSTLIDWVATQPGVQLDVPGDPRIGMVGGSYGGGIQLVTAAIDCRVDA